MSAHHHREQAAHQVVRVAVITVSSTRTEADDTGGQFLVDTLTEASHQVAARSIVDDDVDAIRGRVREHVEAGIDVVLLTGGTGITARDVTPEAVEGLLTRRLDGFGELFRWLSFEEIGAAAMLSRAVGGLVERTVVFALPGSPKACRLGLQQLILPELQHLVHLASKAEAVGRGWQGALRAMGAQLRLDQRAEIPDVAAAPVRNVLQSAGEVGTLEVGGRRYSLWGFPDLQRASSKVLAVRAAGEQLEVLALHRHPQRVGTVVSDGAISGEPGTFAVAGDTRFVLEAGRVSSAGDRPRDLGSGHQALASLVLEWSQR
ncbi:MAG: molybdenum cofactor biosynthesis protein MoaB [Myxococcales bacterium]|nr:molybdenum cofactor biosynthesis protein MoaB [Myxococcales bacterium]